MTAFASDNKQTQYKPTVLKKVGLQYDRFIITLSLQHHLLHLSRIIIKIEMYRLLLITLILTLSLAQDALISTQEPFTLKYNGSKTVSESYLMELNTQHYMTEWTSMVAYYLGKDSDAIMEVEFAVVTKKNPNQIHQRLNKCRFVGAKPQWCKIGSRSPPLNLHHHLLKINLECPTQCFMDVIVGLTETQWDGTSNPNFAAGPLSSVNVYSTTKTQALIKIVGWMLITLLLVLGAIQFAIKVADYFDNKRAVKRRGSRGHQKND